ncbi:hypothetical protein IMZ11_02180 [Microtetraspora sp. AC03309]|uniref:hypothetical protein n=1 Tax=Microtetraspora sp. AC03309 TaxID=2779376 RepID=UPI001E5C036C|nr:hypothetical protein [Microtetraspora sp. AC03309]MCC5574448.1 hypothetical protein [Microtetraspora sp. AC03309]
MHPTITNRSLRETKRAERSLRRQLGGVGGELGQMWRVLAPWALLAAALIGAPATWLLASLGQVEGFTASCIAVAGVAVAAVSLHLTRGRRFLGRAHELFNVTAPVAVVAYTVGFGPDKYVLIAATIFGAASAIVWNRRHTSTAIRELEQVANGKGAVYGDMPARWREFAAEHMPSLADSTMTVLKDTRDEFVAGLDLGEAGVPSDVGPLLERLTRFAGGVVGGASLITGDYLDKVGVRIARRDPLKTAMPWQGPNAPGESMIEPIEGIGRYRDFVELSLRLPFVAGRNGEPDKQQSHLAIIGMSRSGKGAAGELIDVNVATRKDGIVVFCDPVKADQSVGPISEGANYVLDTTPKIRAFFHRLVNKTIPDRAAYLGNPTRNQLGRVLREWAPGCGLSWVMVHVAEAAALYNNQDMTKITERAASVGIEIVIEAQKGIHDRIDTNARSNMAALLCFGTYDMDDASLVLPPELIDLGANPAAWRNKQPGTCYVVFPELTLARQAMPARFARHAPDGSDIAAALAEYMHLASPCDPITAASWGEPYARYRAEIDARHDRSPRQHALAGAVLLDRASTPVAPPVQPADPPSVIEREEEDMGFDLTPPGWQHEDSDSEDEPGAEDEQRDVEEAAENVVVGMVNALGDDPEAQGVLDLAYDGLARYGRDDEDDQADGLYVPRPDIEFPDDPDEAHFELIPSRDEAIDVLLDILKNDISEGNTFKPSHLYEAIEARAKRSDSWVRRCMKPLQGWGCIEETDSYGVYLVKHTNRGDLTDYPE